MCKLLQERGINVILAQEVLLGSGKSYSLPGYEMHHCSCMEGKKKCRGIATFIRRGLKARVENIKTPTGTDAQKIALWWDGKRFDLVNWYRPPSDKAGFPRYWRIRASLQVNSHSGGRKCAPHGIRLRKYGRLWSMDSRCDDLYQFDLSSHRRW